MLEEQYDNEADIPEGYRHLYGEKDGVFKLLLSSELKTTADIDRVQTGLKKERTAHEETKTKLRAFGDLDPEEVTAKLDRFDELEEAAKGKLDDAAIDDLANKRAETKLKPLQRENEKLKTQVGEQETAIGEYKTTDRRRRIRDEVRKQGKAANLTDGGLLDALAAGDAMLKIDEDTGEICNADGLGVDAWLVDMRESHGRGHWWGDSVGAGSRGSGGRSGGGVNPFSAEGWNMTEQGKLVKQDSAKAEQLAKLAGTTVGGKKPPPKK